MADDKRGREKQSRDADRRQRERDTVSQLERWDETEPELAEASTDELAPGLDDLAFPATGTAVVEAVGERAVEAPSGTVSVAELVPDTTAETFASPESVRLRVQRPTVAGAMKEILEAAGTLQNESLDDSQRHAYEKTLRALKGIDADDEDEGVEVVRDWLVAQIRERERLPDSRSVRREAAEFCRANGYEVRDDEWLGV